MFVPVLADGFCGYGSGLLPLPGTLKNSPRRGSQADLAAVLGTLEGEGLFTNKSTDADPPAALSRLAMSARTSRSVKGSTG